MPKVIKSNGDQASTTSTFCPECSESGVDKTVNKESDFDENGWFFLVSFLCTNKKCGHKWTEKIITVPGGIHFR